VRLSLHAVEVELARLWEEEARASGAARVELLTLVALVSDLGLLDRAQRVVATAVRAYPSRTIVATWTTSAPAGITADATLHRLAPGGAACGDAIRLEATGVAREWLPENIDRLALPDLPVCVWWVGDLPDFDRLFDRMVVNADVVVVNSGEMDLRDLEKLSTIVRRFRGDCTLNDLTWIRLRPIQDLIARFFDDPTARDCLSALERVTIEFVPREGEQDVASTQAGLLFGWMASALSLPAESVAWKRGAGWSEATFGRVVARFAHCPRGDVPTGSIQRVLIECDGARFDVERQDDPQVFRWSREAPGAPVPPQTLRVGIPEEEKLLVRCLERPTRDRLLERSLYVGSRIVRPVAPRLSGRSDV
jgi:glucose-6-phosphate dehydrogenase assembly protein OpcA